MTISLDIGSPDARRAVRRTHDPEELLTCGGVERGDLTVAAQPVQALALHPEQAWVECVLTQEEAGEIEWPDSSLSREAESELQNREGIVAGRDDQAPDASRDLYRTFPDRTRMNDISPIVRLEVADGLVERGAEVMRFGIAEEPTRMPWKTQTVVGMVDQAHQRLNLGNDRNGFEDANPVRELCIDEIDELGWSFFGQLDVEILVPSDHAHRQRWTERKLRMAAVASGEGDCDASAPERAIEEPHDVEVGDETDRVRLLKTQPVLVGGFPPRPPPDAAAPEELSSVIGP